jgi:D-alanyl-D-alanine carboxypeptidase
MPTPIVPVDILSTYFDKQKQRLKLPERLAHSTPDTRKAVLAIKAELETAGVNLFLSDMFRSHDMQLQAHIENAKKGVFSPLPGGSMHEAGRAMDLDLDALLLGGKLTLADFWKIAGSHGFFPIVSKPDSGLKEAWHFDCRGSHGKVRQYYLDGKGNAKMKPYTAMAASGILAIGVQVDQFQDQKAAAIQSALIRLDHDPGAIDGSIGNKTRKALADAGIPPGDDDATLSALEDQLKQRLPDEFETGD